MQKKFGDAARQRTLLSRRRVSAALAVTVSGLAAAGVATSASGHIRSSEASAKAPNIAIVTRDFTNPYWAALKDGATAECKKLGIAVTVKAASSETDANGENNVLTTLASQPYNCYGVVPVNSTNVITPLVPIAHQKIPILDLDTQISPSASKAAKVSYASFLGSDNVQAGQLAGREMLKALGGHGKVVILQGIAGEQNGINRDNGFAKAVAGHLKIVEKQPADYEEEKAFQVTQAVLQAHPDINGIFASNDEMALGAAQAVKDAGKTGKVKIVSVDGIQDALTLIKSGQIYGTVTQYPYVEGEYAVQACQALVAGKKVPSRIVSPVAFINKGNVARQLADFPKPIAKHTDPLAGLTK